MGWLTKKPGGTFMGNLFRAGSSKVAPGLLGTGANRIEFGQTLTNGELAGNMSAGQSFNDQLFGPSVESKTMTWVLTGLVVLFGGIAAYASGIFSSKKRKGRFN